MESILYCGTCTATLYSMPLAGLTQNEGLIWKLELSVSSRLLATSCWLKPDGLRPGAVDVQEQRRRRKTAAGRERPPRRESCWMRLVICCASR